MRNQAAERLPSCLCGGALAGSPLTEHLVRLPTPQAIDAYQVEDYKLS